MGRRKSLRLVVTLFGSVHKNSDLALGLFLKIKVLVPDFLRRTLAPNSLSLRLSYNSHKSGPTCCAV